MSRLKSNPWRTAFSLRAAVRSLEALERKGMVVRRKKDKTHWTQKDDTVYEWDLTRYTNGMPKFAADGTMMDEKGNRSIFDDVDT